MSGYESPAWWCIRCGAPNYYGSPEDGCGCGFHQEVQP